MVWSEANPSRWTPAMCASSWLIRLDKITIRIAVPIEAPACLMMFIAVLVRAIAASGTACKAADIDGIIDRPLPSPRTKVAPARSRYDV